MWKEIVHKTTLRCTVLGVNSNKIPSMCQFTTCIHADKLIWPHAHKHLCMLTHAYKHTYKERDRQTDKPEGSDQH